MSKSNGDSAFLTLMTPRKRHARRRRLGPSALRE